MSQYDILEFLKKNKVVKFTARELASKLCPDKKDWPSFKSGFYKRIKKLRKYNKEIKYEWLETNTIDSRNDGVYLYWYPLKEEKKEEKTNLFKMFDVKDEMKTRINDLERNNLILDNKVKDLNKNTDEILLDIKKLKFILEELRRKNENQEY